MSSNAFSTVLLPEPERPVRMTSWRESCLEGSFTEGASSRLYPALVRARDAHVFAILGNCAARDVDAPVVEFFCNLLVSERLRGVFFLDHLFNEALQRQQGHSAAFGTVHCLAEERTKFEHALRSMCILAGHGAAHRRWMHADFFRHFFDHHGLQSVGAVIEKFSLPRDDRLADAKDGVFALLDIFHQLNSGGEALLDVVANVAIRGIARQQPAIRRTQPKL